jgi:thiamine biosynthesis lipoprotein
MLPGSASFEAFGCQAVVAVADVGALPAARATVEEIVAEFDRACSRFRSDSGLSTLNAAAGTTFRADPTLIEAVCAALRAARLTDGAVDPTVGEALVALGYDRDFAAVTAGDPQQARRTDAPSTNPARTDAANPARTDAAPPDSPRILAAPGWRVVKVDPDAGTIRLPRGVALDLGATAKALAADRAAGRALEACGCGVLVSFGGDLAVAGQPPPEGWRIRVTDDHRSDAAAPGQWIRLPAPCGLATSSTVVRRWERHGGPVHHLIDPATGRSAESPWRTVTVNAASCLDANIAATAAIIRGHDAVRWLRELRLPSRLVSREGRAVHLAGWPVDGDDLGGERA